MLYSLEIDRCMTHRDVITYERRNALKHHSARFKSLAMPAQPMPMEHEFSLQISIVEASSIANSTSQLTKLRSMSSRNEKNELSGQEILISC